MAYDEVGSNIDNYRKFAEKAAIELLGKTRAKAFVQRIYSAQTQASISRVMAEVRRAI